MDLWNEYEYGIMAEYYIRGEFQIENVFVLDYHGFIRQKEDFVG